jgi:hypothetical protein
MTPACARPQEVTWRGSQPPSTPRLQKLLLDHERYKARLADADFNHLDARTGPAAIAGEVNSRTALPIERTMVTLAPVAR